jgi:hypothetical protein
MPIPGRYGAALQACLDDDGVDGVLAILTPQAMTDPTQAARTVIDIARQSDKPLVTCWMGEDQVGEARKLFQGAGIPTFPHAGTGGRPVLACLQLLPQPAVADADAALDFRTGAAAPRIGAPGDRNRADGRAQDPQRNGIEGHPVRLQDSHRANHGGPLRLRGNGAGRRTRPAGGDEDRLAADRAQERLRRRAPQPQQPRRRARRLAGDHGRR